MSLLKWQFYAFGGRWEIASKGVLGVSPSVSLIWFNLHGLLLVCCCCRYSDALEGVLMLAKKTDVVLSYLVWWHLRV